MRSEIADMIGVAEEWRPIPGIESEYEVSDFGHVRSVPQFNRTAGRQNRKTWKHV